MKNFTAFKKRVLSMYWTPSLCSFSKWTIVATVKCDSLKQPQSTNVRFHAGTIPIVQIWKKLRPTKHMPFFFFWYPRATCQWVNTTMLAHIQHSVHRILYCTDLICSTQQLVITIYNAPVCRILEQHIYLSPLPLPPYCKYCLFQSMDKFNIHLLNYRQLLL